MALLKATFTDNGSNIHSLMIKDGQQAFSSSFELISVQFFAH